MMFLNWFRFAFFRKRAAAVEQSLQGIQQALASLREKTAADRASAVAAMRVMAEEVTRLDAVEKTLNGVGL
jgi:hypothetical protein